jgi:GntR family transcriptional repressor for pyruvate dehydrogenase complex
MAGANTFTPITVKATASLVCEQIENLIRTGALKPGEKLPPERELSRLLLVSRPVVRQAFAKLEAQGLVHTSYGGGTFVTNALGTQLVDPLVHILLNGEDGALQYLEYRKEVEGAAAALAAERATAFDREILQLVFSDMERIHATQNSEQEAAVDVRFHLAIIDASHNSFFASISRAMYNVLWKNIRDSWTKICADESVRQAVLEQHRDVKNAVVSGDPHRANAAMCSHIEFVMDRLRQHFEQNRREAAARTRLLAFKEESGRNG